jgi:hypothetical protein
MMLKGAPPQWPRLLRLLPDDFVPHFDALSAVLAVLITIGALVVLRVLWDKPGKGLTAWVIGITLTWSLLMTLWTPWLDYAKSYRSVFASMPIPNSVDCIASINLGEGERAMLRYVTGHNPVRREVSPDAARTTLLIQREAAFGEPDIDLTKWKEIWRGARPDQTNERFWLFRASQQTLARNRSKPNKNGKPPAHSPSIADLTCPYSGFQNGDMGCQIPSERCCGRNVLHNGARAASRSGPSQRIRAMPSVNSTIGRDG